MGSLLLKVQKPLGTRQTLTQKGQSRTEKISSCEYEYRGKNREGEHRVFCSSRCLNRHQEVGLDWILEEV